VESCAAARGLDLQQIASKQSENIIKYLIQSVIMIAVATAMEHLNGMERIFFGGKEPHVSPTALRN
jgi:hypothetical protein